MLMEGSSLRKGNGYAADYDSRYKVSSNRDPHFSKFHREFHLKQKIGETTVSLRRSVSQSAQRYSLREPTHVKEIGTGRSA
jgi:hypothetical protein